MRARRSKIIKGVHNPPAAELTKREKSAKRICFKPRWCLRLEQKEEKRKPFSSSSGSSAAEIGFPHRSRICFSFECALYYYADACVASGGHYSSLYRASTQKSARSRTHTRCWKFQESGRSCKSLNFGRKERELTDGGTTQSSCDECARLISSGAGR
jgi:hypothetical protein